MTELNHIYFIDLFAGAGGTSTGAHLAGVNVIACVNHDAKAIASHKANHPETLHFTEDIRDFAVVEKLKVLVDQIRREDPLAIIAIWASLECTNFSNAKGGMPRDADSRTLAEHLFMYLDELNPDYLMIENVREFMSWGDLDGKGKPVSRDKGRLYQKWVSNIIRRNYNYEYQLLNSANFGAYTARLRFFAIFAKKGLPITFPEPTHSKTVEEGGLFPSEFKKWKAVREVLDLEDEGSSIFTRKKPLVDKTLQRIYAGLIKFVAKGDDSLLIKWNSMNRNGYYKAPSLDDPCPTVSCQNRLGVATVERFLVKNFSGRPMNKVHSIDKPCGAVTCVDNKSLVFLSSYYKNGSNRSIDEPASTLTTKDRLSLIIPFLDNQYGNGFPSSIEAPCGTVTTSPKQALVTPKWLLNPQYNDKGRALNKPCFTLIARMDKAPPYMMSTARNSVSIIRINKEDSEITKLVKQFCIAYGLSDIKMRMLKIPELLQIQGFPGDYHLEGTQADQKKQIGNAVEVNTAKALIKANFSKVSIEKCA